MKRIPQDVPGGGRPEVYVMPLIAAARDPTMPAAYSPVPEPAMESAGPSTTTETTTKGRGAKSEQSQLSLSIFVLHT